MPIATPPAIFGIGRNYLDHAKELGNEPPDKLLVFMKNPASVIANGEPIVIPNTCREPHEQVDYEGELAAIIGPPGTPDPPGAPGAPATPCRDVSEADALNHVSHYAIANDVSARWWQKHGSGGQFIRGKSFDTFCPISEPLPTSAITNPQALELQTTLNGEVVQQASTSLMMWSVAAIIAELSRGTTLLPGTVILTGTPAGVGAAQTPPRFLREGDVVEVTISGLGALRNPVRVECVA